MTSGRLMFQFEDVPSPTDLRQLFLLQGTNNWSDRIRITRSGSNILVSARWNVSETATVTVSDPGGAVQMEVIYDFNNGTAANRLRARSYSVGASAGTFTDTADAGSAAANAQQWILLRLGDEENPIGASYGKVALCNSTSEDLSNLTESGGAYSMSAGVGTFTLAGNATSLVRVQFLTGVTTQSNAGAWLSTGANLWSVVDEANADDNDYVYSPDNPTAAMCEIGLGPGLDPNSSSGHKVRYRASAINQDAVLTVRLMQGAATIAVWTSSLTAGAGVTGFEQTLSAGETDSITDYNNLRIQLSAS